MYSLFEYKAHLTKIPYTHSEGVFGGQLGDSQACTRSVKYLGFKQPEDIFLRLLGAKKCDQACSRLLFTRNVGLYTAHVLLRMV